MSDVMKIATDRKAELEKSIVALEQQITDIREEMATLDDFLEYGAGLMAQDGKPTQPVAKPAPSADAVQKRKSGDLPSLGEKKAVDPFDQPDGVAGSVSELRPTERRVSRPA